MRTLSRRLIATLLLLAPTASLVAIDVFTRRHQLAEYTREALVAYAVTAGISAAIWSSLVVAFARARGAARVIASALLAALAVFAVGTQLYALRRYGVYLDFRVALMGNSLSPPFGYPMRAHPLVVVLLFALPAAFALAIGAVYARIASPRVGCAAARAFDVGTLAVAVALFYGKPDADWDTGGTLDVLYLSSVGALAHSRWTGEDVMNELTYLPATRAPTPLPPLAPSLRPRNVVLVVSESVRALDACSGHGDDCETTPFTDALLPDRFGFRQMRAVDSSTAISIAVIWSGLAPTAPRAQLLSAPLLWEYAHAARYDTAYLTSQNLLFANAGRWLDGLPLTRFVSGTSLEPYATYQCGADDGKLVDRALADLPALHEPYFAVVHLSNTHFPYCVESGDTPFQDRAREVRAQAGEPDEPDDSYNRYRDAIRRQDREVARLVSGLRAARSGDASPTVVAFMSDHGEQLHERGQIGHTWSLYDEEVHVPFWIDAPRSALTSDEESALRGLEQTRLTALDVAPTMLDLMGLLDAPELAALRARMPGQSLLRGAPPADRAVVMTNCTELFSCATKNWGAMRGPLKLIATEDEDHGAWKCFDVASDAEERRELSLEQCGDLKGIAEGDGRGRP